MRCVQETTKFIIRMKSKNCGKHCENKPSFPCPSPWFSRLVDQRFLNRRFYNFLFIYFVTFRIVWTDADKLIRWRSYVTRKNNENYKTCLLWPDKKTRIDKRHSLTGNVADVTYGTHRPALQVAHVCTNSKNVSTTIIDYTAITMQAINENCRCFLRPIILFKSLY